MKYFMILLFVLLFAGYAQADDFESRLSNMEFNQRKMQQAYDDLSKYNNCTSPGPVSLPMPKGMAEYYARQAQQDIEYYSREMEYDRRMLESDVKQHNRNMEFNQMEFNQRKMQQAYDDLSKYNNCTSPGPVSLPMPKGMAEYYARQARQDIEYYSREMEYGRRMLESDIKQHNRDVKFNQTLEEIDALSKLNNYDSSKSLSLSKPTSIAECDANQKPKNSGYKSFGAAYLSEATKEGLRLLEKDIQQEMLIQEIEKREKDTEFEAIRQKPQKQSNNRGKVFKIGTKR